MAWSIDPTHSHVEFAVKHLMISTVRGSFRTFEGTLNLDEANPENSHVEVSIDVASIDTREAQRDAHLRSGDFFDAENFPKLTFKSKRVEFPNKGNLDEFRIVGDLTIRDVTREVVLNATSAGKVKTPFGTTAWGFTAATNINRKDFGLGWNVALETGGWLVGEEVKISIELEAVQQPETAAANA